jgi:hypothetical protein
MNIRTYRTAAIKALFVTLLPAAAAHAQIGDLLKSQGGSGSTSGLGSLSSGMSLQSLSSGSTGNIAGVLQYCIKNNYLSGDAASSVKDTLMGKLPGGSSASSSDSGYLDGAKGILNSNDGKQLDLSGGGLKAEATKQVCNKILEQGKSLL